MTSSQTVQGVKRVAIIGPECTGKSDLSAFLAEHYKTEWVPEYARGYIGNLNRPYTEDDLLKIAHGQLTLEEEYVKDANGVLFCDTNLYVIKVWSLFKFGQCHDEIIRRIAEKKYDLYLLTYVDIPWEADPLREHPDRREELYAIYLEEMKKQSVPFVEIKGSREARQAAAISATGQIMS